MRASLAKLGLGLGHGYRHLIRRHEHVEDRPRTSRLLPPPVHVPIDQRRLSCTAAACSTTTNEHQRVILVQAQVRCAADKQMQASPPPSPFVRCPCPCMSPSREGEPTNKGRLPGKVPFICTESCQCKALFKGSVW